MQFEPYVTYVTKKIYTTEMSTYMDSQLQLSTQAGSEKFKKRTKWQSDKMTAEMDVLENKSKIPNERKRINNLKSEIKFIKGTHSDWQKSKYLVNPTYNRLQSTLKPNKHSRTK